MRSVSPIPEHSRSHVGSSVNVHSSSQAINQGRTSPGSIYSVAPDLVGLAHPQIKGSRLNLHDQGPEMVREFWILQKPIQHMSINHLPEETNSKAVISALRTLKRKSTRLEVDKQSAKDKISDLEKDLIQTRHLLINEQTRTWTRQQPPEDISSQLNSNLVESPVITANDVQRRKLEDQVKFLESELKNTRQAFDREHRIAEVSQEAQAIAAELVKEAEIKATESRGYAIH
ncbi:hypothetical protein BC829DRAFT_1965 [Chytridium lagenaria]|nr:hypothetical protein BC829DRAFT_1965 [Chytridium lagenaria]